MIYEIVVRFRRLSMPSGKRKYVDCLIVAGGRKLVGKYTYALPPALARDVKIGSLLLVPARKKLRFAVALDFPGKSDVDETKSEVDKIKDVISVFDGPPIVSDIQIEAAKWLGAYYVVPPVPAMKPFLVELKGLKVAIYVSLARTADFQDKLNELGLLFVHKTTLEALLNGKRVTKRKFENLLSEGGIEKEKLDESMSRFIAEGVIRQDYVIEHRRKVTRKGARSKVEEYAEISIAAASEPVPSQLTAHQEDALDKITVLMNSGESSTVLLHGVTGSGKTEIYVRAAGRAVESGKQVLVLVPEIALTHQVVRRFARDFPGRLAVLHSELSEAERVGEWERIHRGEVDIVIGARSALFAPLERLGLIVLDEEHEPSYKQSAMPRYHARELARRMAALHKAVLVLGSATPSVESYELAREGHFKLIDLPERISGGELPKIELVKRRFVKVEIPGGKVVRRLEVITETLREAIEDVLSRGKQALLFLNQRGFAKTLACPECGQDFLCPSCYLPLVYHAKSNSLLCHHCDFKRAAPKKCANCGDVDLINVGIGTQRLEDEIARLFPEHPLHRLDRDVSEVKGSKRVLDDFRSGKARILLGTQMIAKGLDFPDVELVGVISAEDSLAIPDFRAAERTFQLLTQVAGRAGRREARGRVIVQGIRLDHYAVRAAVDHDYKSFFEQEREIRQRFGYPPFKHLGRAVVSSKEYDKATLYADVFGDELRKIMGRSKVVDILGPAPAPLERLRGSWRRHLVFKSEKVAPMSALLRKGLSRIHFPSEVTIEIDVDPLSML